MMKLPIQAQPIVRKVRTALTIGGGMVLSQNGETECFRYCLKKIPMCDAREGDCGFSECLKNCKKIKYP